MEKNHTALLVIDVQQEMFEKSTPVYQAQEFLQRLAGLIRQAHGAGVPVIFIQHSADKYLVRGTPGWQFHPDLAALEPNFTIHKLQSNSFEDTDLDSNLKSLGVDTLVVTGMVTHGCVKNTCLGGLRKGYRVVLVSDGHSSYSPKAADLIKEWNEKLARAGVVLTRSAEIQYI